MSPAEKLSAAIDLADKLRTRAQVSSVQLWGANEFTAAFLQAENEAIDAAAAFAGISRTADPFPPKT